MAVLVFLVGKKNHDKMEQRLHGGRHWIGASKGIRDRSGLTSAVDLNLHGKLSGHAEEVPLKGLLDEALFFLRHPCHLLCRFSRFQPFLQLFQGGRSGGCRHGYRGLLVGQAHRHGETIWRRGGQSQAITFSGERSSQEPPEGILLGRSSSVPSINK